MITIKFQCMNSILNGVDTLHFGILYIYVYHSSSTLQDLDELGEQWRTMENSRGPCVPNCAQRLQ